MLNIIFRLFNKILSIFKESLYNRYANLKIGEGTVYCNENLDGICPQLIEIGKDCVFSPKSIVLTHDASLVPTTGKYIFLPVHIGNRVFVGFGAVIMPGVVVGDDVVIGSNAVVTKDISSGSVVAGVPAKFICSTQELIKKRKDKLQPAIFDWHKPVGLKEMIAQQSKLIGKCQ